MNGKLIAFAEEENLTPLEKKAVNLAWKAEGLPGVLREIGYAPMADKLDTIIMEIFTTEANSANEKRLNQLIAQMEKIID